MRWTAALVGLVMATSAWANDWQKFYTPVAGSERLIRSEVEPEVIPSSGDITRDLELMWRRGFAPYGYSSFSSGNSNTKDAFRLAKKLKARYVIVATQLASLQTSSVPLTLPNTTTSVSNGNVAVSGSGGSGYGNYSGTTTTYGSQTTYIPVTVNRFDKFAAYLGEAPKEGTGIYWRELEPAEVAQYETRRAFAVQFVRDDSPAYHADILPGDVITHVNGLPADDANWRNATKADEPMRVHLIRNGQPRDLTMVVPAAWRPVD